MQNPLILIPNTITLFRIAGAGMLLFFEPLSVPFFTLYLFCGFTDAADGFLARKLHAESRFGAALDGCADAVFILISLCVFLTCFSAELWVWVVFGVVAALKISALCLRWKKSKKFGFSASKTNKIAGLIIFLFPFLAVLAGVNAAVLTAGSITIGAAGLELRDAIQKKEN